MVEETFEQRDLIEKDCGEYFWQREQLEGRHKMPHIYLHISQGDSLSLEKGRRRVG